MLDRSVPFEDIGHWVDESYSATASEAKNMIMPLPLLFIGIAAAAGAVGAGKSVKAGIDSSTANSINKNANHLVEESTARLNTQREACGRALRVLGEQKLFVLNNSAKQFLDSFNRIKNVDFTESTGLEELKNCTSTSGNLRNSSRWSTSPDPSPEERLREPQVVR